MKLLIVTQKVDRADDILGFFHEWIEEFAKHVEHITVICLYEGRHKLPSNVSVLSLGKELGVSKLQYLVQFYTYVWSERANYDSVFVHMNQIYVLLGGLLWKLWGKKIFLWYTHKNISGSLRVAVYLCHKVFSASKESFRLTTKKLQIMGHAIDVEKYSRIVPTTTLDPFTIVSIGRISPVKNIDKIIAVTNKLVSRGINTKCLIVGGPGTPEQQKYYDNLVNSAGKHVTFTGPVLHKEIGQYLSQANMFLHLSETGSTDKVVLEAMAAGIPVISSSEAFEDVLEPLGFFLRTSAVEGVVDLVKSFVETYDTEANKVGESLRSYVTTNHNMQNTIKKLMEEVEV